MKKVDLSVIIVNWNSANYVLHCVESIYEQTKDVSFEIIVVDNASYDDCHKILNNRYPDIVLIQTHVNIGFAGANNIGAKKARGKKFLFLNPDTIVIDRSIDRLFYKFKKINNPGVVGCKILNSDGSLQTSCVQSFPTILNQSLDSNFLRKLFPKLKLWGTQSFLEDGLEPKKVNVISGACMMVNSVDFFKVGSFSTDYFMYAEDIDLCYQMLSKNLNNYFYPAASIIHHGGGTTKKKENNFGNVMIRESVRKYFLKTRGIGYSRFYRTSFIFISFLRTIGIGIVYFYFKILGIEKNEFLSLKKWMAIFGWSIGIKKFIR